MLEVSISIVISDRYLVKDLNFTLNKGDKLAIIGEEGNGKSTLLKVLLGNCSYAKVEGNINYHQYKLGYLAQTLTDNRKVIDYLFSEEEDYYNNLNELYKHLKALELHDTILNQLVNNLSGGEKVKLGLLKLLLDKSDILLLDEPTNDLDIKTLTWLENFINKTSKPIIFVSHDEVLLTKTANMILHLEQLRKKTTCRHTFMRTCYEDYVKMRLNSLDKQSQLAKNEARNYYKQQAKLNKIMQIVENKQNTITRKDPHGAKVLKKKMHTLKAQEKRLNKTELLEKPDVEERINLTFEQVTIPQSKVILNLNLPALSIDDRLLAVDIKLEIIGNQHVAIIGENGVGKSTLLKKIYHELQKRQDIKVGYMPQNYDEVLNNYENALAFLTANTSKEMVTKARLYLGNMHFTQAEMLGKISDLSNGSKAKLILMKLVMEHYDCLVLDEPTRNISPLSSPVVRQALKDYTGVIISVSHDRKYLEEVIDSVYLLTSKGLEKKTLYDV